MSGRSTGQHMLPQQPSKQTATAPPHKTKNLNPSCCRSCGGMRGWPVHRPTHAPATTLKTNGNSARPPKQKPPRAVSPETARRRMTTPVVNTHPDTGAIPKENQNPSCRPLLRRHVAQKPTSLVPSSPEHVKQSPSPSSFRNLRRKAGMPPHCSAWECVPRSSASHSRSRNHSQNKPQRMVRLLPRGGRKLIFIRRGQYAKFPAFPIPTQPR